MLVRFIVPHGKTFLNIDNLAAHTDMGGIKCAHIVLHSSIMYLRNVLNYIKLKKENQSISDQDYYIEYNIGQQLSSLFNFHCDMRTPHAFQPNKNYDENKEIIRG